MKKKIITSVCLAAALALVAVMLACTGTPEKTELEIALIGVNGTFKASGSYSFNKEGAEPETLYVTTTFGEKAVNIVETDADGAIVYDDVYVDVNGKIGLPYHTVNNEIDYHYAADDEKFEDYGNPFKLLTAADFAATDTAGVYSLSAAKAESAATAITGYTERIASFTVTIKDGKVVKVNIVTDRIHRGKDDDENAYYYTSEYEFDVSEWGTAEIDSEKIAPFETKPEHTALADALKKARDAKTYTAMVQEWELVYNESTDNTELVDPLFYGVYVTEDTIYSNCVDWEGGYIQMPSGDSSVVYPFNYDVDTKTALLFDAVSGFPTIYSMRAGFIDFAPEIFTLSNGSYILRDDMATYDNVRDVLFSFANGYDEMRLYLNHGLKVSISLESGSDNIRVNLEYYVYGFYGVRSIIFCNFDDTDMPVEIEHYEKNSVLDDYVGTYTDGTVTAVIDESGITIDGSEFEVTEYSVQLDMFTGNWNGGVWYLTKHGEKQLILYSIEEDTTYVLTNTAIEPVSIPDEFEGVWSKGDNAVAIAYDKIEFNDTMLKVLSYDEEDGLYATDGEKTYRFFAETNDGKPVVLAIVYVDGLSTAYYDMTAVDNAFIIPEILVGTFEKDEFYYNEYYKAVVGLTSISLELNGYVPEAVTVVSATHSHGYWELTLDLDGVEYSLTEGSYSDDQIDIYSEEARFGVTLNRVDEGPSIPSVEVPESFFGKYTGEKNSVEYEVFIGATGNITVTIDGVDYVATVIEYDEDYDELGILVDGDTCWISTTDDGITYYNEDTYFFISLTRAGVVIPDELIGTFEGEDSYADIPTTVKVVVTKDSVEVHFNGAEQTVTVEKVEDGYYGVELYVIIDSVRYVFGPVGNKYSFSSADDYGATLYASLTKTDGNTDDYDWSKFIGTFSGTNSNCEYVITITESDISVTVDGVSQSVSIDDYDELEGFTITLAGGVYYITQADYADTINKIAFMSEDYTIRFTLDRV